MEMLLIYCYIYGSALSKHKANKIAQFRYIKIQPETRASGE